MGKSAVTCGSCSAEVDISRAGTADGRPRFAPEIDRAGDTVSGFVLEERIGALLPCPVLRDHRFELLARAEVLAKRVERLALPVHRGERELGAALISFYCESDS